MLSHLLWSVQVWAPSGTRSGLVVVCCGVTPLHPWPCTAEGAAEAFEGSLWESHAWRPVHGGRKT